MGRVHLRHLISEMFAHDLRTSKIDNRWTLLQFTPNLCENLLVLLHHLKVNSLHLEAPAEEDHTHMHENPHWDMYMWREVHQTLP